MTNHDLSSLLTDLADEPQEYRNSPLEMSNSRYDRLKALELKAREAAREVEKSRELQPEGE